MWSEKKSVPRKKNPNESSGEKHVRYGVRGCCLAADGSFRVLRMWCGLSHPALDGSAVSDGVVAVFATFLLGFRSSHDLDSDWGSSPFNVRLIFHLSSDPSLSVFGLFVQRVFFVRLGPLWRVEHLDCECRVPGEGRYRKKKKVTKQLRTNCCEVQEGDEQLQATRKFSLVYCCTSEKSHVRSGNVWRRC